MTIDAYMEDGRLSVKERIALDMLAAEDETIIEYRAREVAADSFKRNGATRLTRDRFRDAGHQLIDLAAERAERRSNVVPIRQDIHA
jgi:alpha-beta hydrolase superfamily lysophospholipase